MKRFLFASILSACFSSGALAQSAGAQLGIGVGQRVRVEAPTILTDRVKGTVASPVLDTLFLKRDAALLPVPVAQITKLEISRGRNRLLWGFVGATAGFFAGGLLGAQTYDTGESDIDGIVAAIAGAAIGTVSGAVVGAIAAPERWRRLPLN